MDNIEKMRRGIIRDMSEGVMAIGFDGKIKFLNRAALEILVRSEEELLNRTFAGCFFEYEENDGFNQAVLDAVYDRSGTHRNTVSYFTGEETRQLNITTSFLRDGEEKIGIIVVISDISELVELRDAIKAMEKIKSLNRQLEMRNKLLGETFGRYLSDEIVKQLLETPDGLELGGKKCQVTAVMSDIRGFTAMCEAMDARSLVTMLNHYLGEMTEIIEKHGKGDVIFKEGDYEPFMYDIYNGKIGIYSGYGTPEQKLIAELGVNDFFGEMGLIEDTVRSATAVAMDADTRVKVVDAETFDDYFRKSPAKVLMLMQQMSSRLRRVNREYAEACRAAGK